MSDLIAVGNYNGKIVGHDLTEIGDKKTPCVVFDVLINAHGVEVERRVLLWLTERALPYTVKSIRELGYHSTQLSGLALEHEEDSGMIGTPVKVSIKHAEDHKGIVRERIGLYPAQKPSAKMGNATLSRFEKLFKREQEKLLQEEEDAPEEEEQVEHDDAVVVSEDEEIPAPPPVKTKKVVKTFQNAPRRERTPF
jgi:hypothetical protein